MKLIHHTISKLSIVMIIILTFWAGFFFYSILDEILDETDYATSFKGYGRD